MKKIPCCLYIIFVLTACANSQTATFQKIEYASFDVNSYRTEKKDSVYIHMYYRISDRGLVEINYKDDYHEKHTYYSVQLTQAEINKLNSVFKQTKKLKTYLANTKMEDNSFYAGSYDFFRVTYSNGAVDSLCMIPPFMTRHFNAIYDFLDNVIYEREDRKTLKQFDVPDLFINSLKSCYLKSTYLPEIKNPPPFKAQ